MIDTILVTAPYIESKEDIEEKCLLWDNLSEIFKNSKCCPDGEITCNFLSVECRNDVMGPIAFPLLVMLPAVMLARKVLTCHP